MRKNWIYHNSNIVLSIFNIKNSFNISFFWLSSWWWSKSSKVVFLIEKHYFLLKIICFQKITSFFQSHFSQICSLKNIFDLRPLPLDIWYIIYHIWYMIYDISYMIYHLSLIHIWRCRRSTLCRSRWSPYH